jgi:hypothetical protein
MMCSITHIYMKDRLEDYNEGNKDRTVPSPFLPYVLLTKKKKKKTEPRVRDHGHPRF